ncbi:unnamed protein product [Protopolystoma xenopodis]|uniref:Mon2/Sec7/BIG1-like dimerisation and cyclophilin-binding domain-containing protein n=1 Tax=Protopolystoma xenopodis TaxID=117903 RepID=A0A448X7V8_9PLAT|nr:unnamed protein product [Protopolystoma xenopodis]
MPFALVICVRLHNSKTNSAIINTAAATFRQCTNAVFERASREDPSLLNANVFDVDGVPCFSGSTHLTLNPSHKGTENEQQEGKSVRFSLKDNVTK